MMMPATAVVVTAGFRGWLQVWAALLCCSLDRLLQCHQLLLQPIIFYFLATNNILTVSTLRQGPVAAPVQRVGGSERAYLSSVVPLSSL